MTHHVKLLSAAVAAALIATPALARTTKNKAALAQDSYAQAGSFVPFAPFQGSYAAADRARAFVRGASPVIAADGRVVGADPDPNVRLELSRDAWQSEY